MKCCALVRDIDSKFNGQTIVELVMIEYYIIKITHHVLHTMVDRFGSYSIDQCLCSVCSGDHIRFWHDPWVNFAPLQQLFPRVFALSNDKTTMIHHVSQHVR